MEDNLFKTIYLIILTSGIGSVFHILSTKHFELSYYDFATIMFVVVIFAAIAFVYLLYADNKFNIYEINEKKENVESLESLESLEKQVKELNKKVIELKGKKE